MPMHSRRFYLPDHRSHHQLAMLEATTHLSTEHGRAILSPDETLDLLIVSEEVSDGRLSLYR